MQVDAGFDAERRGCLLTAEVLFVISHSRHRHFAFPTSWHYGRPSTSTGIPYAWSEYPLVR